MADSLKQCGSLCNMFSAQVTMGLKETHQGKCIFRITCLLYMGAFGNFCQWICSIQYIGMYSCLTSLKPRMKMTVMLCCCTNTRNSRICWTEKDLLALESVVGDSHFHLSSCLYGVWFHFGLTVSMKSVITIMRKINWTNYWFCSNCKYNRNLAQNWFWS